jgi:hypothetical protein
MKAITENTFIPISLMIILLGGSAFVTTVYNKTEANANEVLVMHAEIKEDQKQYLEDQRQYVKNHAKIMQQLARIQERLGIKPGKDE